MMGIQYTNFDLKLDGYEFTADGAEKFSANVTHKWGQMQGGAVAVQLDGDVRKRVVSLDRGDLGESEIKAFGQALGGYLFAGKVRDELEICARRCKQDDAAEPDTKHRLRIRLWISHPPLASLPWEFAYVSRTDSVREGFVALNELFSLVRFETLGQPISTLAPADPTKLRMVAVFSNPEQSEKLPGIPGERNKIDASIRATWPSMQLTVIPKDGSSTRVTPGDLNAAMQGDVHLFHFSGHGDFPIKGLGMAGMPSPGRGEIVLDKGDGNAFLYSADDLADALQGRGVRLAFLNACNVGKRDSTHYFTGIAPALQDAGVPAVIGMQFKVRDDNAEVFSEVFYRVLAETNSVDRAVLEGRKQVFANNKTSGETRPHRDWGTPVLYLRAEGDGLFAAIEEKVAVNGDNSAQDETVPPKSDRVPVKREVKVPHSKSWTRPKMFKLLQGLTRANLQELCTVHFTVVQGSVNTDVEYNMRMGLLDYCDKQRKLDELAELAREMNPTLHDEIAATL